MFQGQYLFDGESFYSPWTPRRGDNLRHSAELLAQLNGSQVLIQVYHKNTEDTGPGTATSGDLNLTTLGTGTAESTGLKELVRFRFTCTGTRFGDYVVFRTLAPVWFDDVEA